jgi:hypothetical protein
MAASIQQSSVAALCGMERCSRTSTCQRCFAAASRTRRSRWRRSIDAVLARLQLSVAAKKEDILKMFS